MTPADILDGAPLRLLGDILQPDMDPATTGALRLRLMGRGFSWQTLVDLARGQGVLLPMIFALTTRGLLPPIPRVMKNRDTHVTAKLGVLYQHHLARRRAEKDQLEGVLQTFHNAGIVPLVLKGARYLVEPVAPWCEARAMADFDILVPAHDAAGAFAALKAQGYQPMLGDGPVHGPNFSHHLPALAHPDQPAAIEIHTHALSAAGRKIMSTRHAWAHAAPAGSGGFLVMPLRWHALHALLHHQIQDRGHVRRVLSIKALWEWTMLARLFTGGDWDAVTAHMRAAGASDVLDSWLVQSHRLFGFAAPHLPAISGKAQAHADATFRLSSRPYWMRRAHHIADQLRVSFARETLANKYDTPLSRVSLRHAGRNVLDLLRRHRGNVWQRLTGKQDQLW